MKNSEDSAFPTKKENWHNENWQGIGLTKREYFAAIALQGLISSGDGVKTLIEKNSTYPDVIAKKAIQYADELLKQLES